MIQVLVPAMRIESATAVGLIKLQHLPVLEMSVMICDNNTPSIALKAVKALNTIW